MICSRRTQKIHWLNDVVTGYTYDVEDPEAYGSQGNRLMSSIATRIRSGGLVEERWYALRNYTYMSDHMGNVAALVDSTSDVARRLALDTPRTASGVVSRPWPRTRPACQGQVFDAFGNEIDGYVTFQCASDHDFTDTYYPPPPAPEPCPLPAAQPIERMQAGGLNWRGGEGSQTDRVAEDMQDTETFDLRWSAYERPSTGLIYMQARYYEPETGRFTQADPLPYGLEMLRGQNNRWVYCANDPVNCSDPSGRIWSPLAMSAGFYSGFLGGEMQALFGGDSTGFFFDLIGLLADIFGSTKCVMGFGFGAQIAEILWDGEVSAWEAVTFASSVAMAIGGAMGIVGAMNPVFAASLGYIGGYIAGYLSFTSALHHDRDPGLDTEQSRYPSELVAAYSRKPGFALQNAGLHPTGKLRPWDPDRALLERDTERAAL